jgi:galactose mutarotase-like enzyme
MNKIHLSSTGTLLDFSLQEKNLIYPFTRNEKERGGAFWCLPNFDEPQNSFSVRHGEYRKNDGVFTGDFFEKRIQGLWGDLQTSCHWEGDETGFTSTMTMTSLSDETLIRPGFHPYFVSKDDMLVQVDKATLSLASLEVDTKAVLMCNESNQTVATLCSAQEKIMITLTASKSECHFSFCVWTDNKSSYLCVEPVCGISYDNDSLPSPFLLSLGETLTLTAKIERQLLTDPL